MTGSRKPVYQVLFSNLSRFSISKPQVERFTLRILRDLPWRMAVVSLVLVTDADMKRLNRKHLNHNHTTDVLSFSLAGSGISSLFAELIISPKRAKVQAAHYGETVNRELARYICHGLLHQAGFSDHKPREISKMRKAEERLLRHLKGLTLVTRGD